jgi:hypothetical protein
MRGFGSNDSNKSNSSNSSNASNGKNKVVIFYIQIEGTNIGYNIKTLLMYKNSTQFDNN